MTIHDSKKAILAQIRNASAALYAAQKLPDGPGKALAIISAISERDDLRAIVRAKNIKLGK